MGRKTNLERALESGMSGLNDAQRELVREQYATYRQNKRRIAEIRDALSAKPATPVSTSGMQAAYAHRAALNDELARLMTVNNDIADRLFNQLSGDVDG